MKKRVLFAGLLWSYLLVSAQAGLDSLLRLVPAAKDDSLKVMLYIAIGNQYELSNLPQAENYYLSAGNLSRQLHYTPGIIKFISNYTQVLNARGAFDSALVLNKQAVVLAQQLGDEVTIAKMYANTGNSFNYLEEYDSCVFYYEMAKRRFQHLNDSYYAARMDDLAQNVYFKLNEFDKAQSVGKSAVAYFRSAGKKVELGQALLNLANNYQSLHNNDSAQACYKEALEISGQTGYKLLELSCLIGIGNFYFHQYQADSMLPYHSAALRLSAELGDVEGQVIAQRGLALHYLLKKNFPAAQTYTNASLIGADSLGLKYEQIEGLKIRASIFFAMHDITQAERYLDSVSVLENQLRSDEIQAKTIFWEKRFETERKEAQIKLQQEQLQQKKIVNWVLLGVVLVVLLIAALIYRTYQQKQKIQLQRINELETERKLTATEAIIKGEEKERVRLAQDLHDGLGGMLSGVKYSLNNMKDNLIMTPESVNAFEHSINMLDNSISEMRRVAHNLMPENLLKFGLSAALKDYCSEIQRGGNLQVNYQYIGLKDKVIEQGLSVTVYRVTQELLNNILKHANATQALVQIGVTDNQLTITVEDNGRGLAEATLKTAQGIGWKNIYSRVYYHKGTVNIQTLPDKGTSVFIEFPIA
ncbi:MAG: histidine kinase [Chitinophagales bacterium]